MRSTGWNPAVPNYSAGGLSYVLYGSHCQSVGDKVSELKMAQF